MGIIKYMIDEFKDNREMRIQMHDRVYLTQEQFIRKHYPDIEWEDDLFKLISK